MPAKSRAQRGYMFILAKRGKISFAKAKEFARGTKGLKVRHVRKRRR